MSQGADAGSSAFAALIESLDTSAYCGVAVSALFIYDTFIILDREVACFWSAKQRTGASLLFLANKWISLAVYICAMVEFAPFPSDQSCGTFLMVSNVFSVLQSVPWAAFSALRAYVLSRSKILGLFILVLSLAPVAANLVPYAFHLSGLYDPLLGCLQTDSTTEALQLSIDYAHPKGCVVVIIARVPLIVADIALIYITWMAPLRNWDALMDVQQTKELSLSDVLFRNGTVYFVILTILNVLHLVFSATALVVDGNFGASNVVVFTAVITAILTGRFLLELQEANRAVVNVAPDHPFNRRDPYDSAPSFVSSLGGFINPDLSASWDDSNAEGRVDSFEEEEFEEEGDIEDNVKSFAGVLSVSV